MCSKSASSQLMYDDMRLPRIGHNLARYDYESTGYHYTTALHITIEFNWMADFFSGHSHCTTYRGRTSSLKSITASIIQGSAIGPISYVVNAGDLRAVTNGNLLVKFADDTYLIVPAINVNLSLI